jgi:hypothetical protein
MAGQYDATITQLAPVVATTGTVTLAAIGKNSPFDALASVEIGAGLNGLSERHELKVSVQNLSKVALKASGALTPTSRTAANAPYSAGLRVPLPAPAGGWGDPGDVLQLVASYIVHAGANTDYSSAFSVPLVVV